jgi:hypothetical protein
MIPARYQVPGFLGFSQKRGPPLSPENRFFV